MLPLTKYNVEQIFKTVSLNTISRYGGGHLGFWIGIQCRRELDPGAAAASYMKGKYIPPSWRRIIFSLDTVDNTSVADELIPYSEPPAGVWCCHIYQDQGLGLSLIFVYACSY